MAQTPVVDVRSLQKTYRDGLLGRRRIEALKGVTLEVGPGEIFGLLGPNGAGKTTLIKVLLGLVRATGGNASLLGRPAGSRIGRRQVGYLPENHRMPRHHTGNSALQFFGSLSGLSQSEIKRRRGPLLSAVGLADWGNTPIRKYSKGMLQRLGLAQAMLHDPQLLILDEPTDGVDPVGRSEMRAILQGLRAAGKTIFINSHLLQELELICDRVAILDRGKVLHQGRIAEITARTIADVQIMLVGQESAVRGAIENHSFAEMRANGQQIELLLKTGEQTVVDSTIDRLRERQVSIVSISRRRQTLEEAFLEILDIARSAP